MTTRKEKQLADRVIAQRFMETLIKWLGFHPAWTVNVRPTPVRDKNIDAGVEHDHTYFHTSIRLAENYHYRCSEERKYVVLVHEAMHLFDRPLDALFDAACTFTKHQTTKDLLQVLVDHECEVKTSMLTAVMVTHPEVKDLWVKAKAGVENV